MLQMHMRRVRSYQIISKSDKVPNTLSKTNGSITFINVLVEDSCGPLDVKSLFTNVPVQETIQIILANV